MEGGINKIPPPTIYESLIFLLNANFQMMFSNILGGSTYYQTIGSLETAII